MGCAASPRSAPPSGAAAAAREPAAAAPGALAGRARGDERELFELVNGERRSAHLPPFAWDERAAEVARAHSRDMMSRGEIGHESPTTGSPADRVHAAGIHVPLVLENVAFAPTVRDAHEGLMHSPGHRANILNPEANRIGIGIVLDPARHDALYVTQVFLRVLGRVDVQKERARLASLIAARRRQAGVAAAASDPQLDRAAQALAEAAATHHGDATAQERERLLGPSLLRFGQARALSAVVADPSTVASKPDVLAPCKALAVGVAQGTHPELGENAIYVVLVLAGTP